MTEQFLCELVDDLIDAAVDYGYACGAKKQQRSIDKAENLMGGFAEKLYNGLGISQDDTQDLLKKLKGLRAREPRT